IMNNALLPAVSATGPPGLPATHPRGPAHGRSGSADVKSAVRVVLVLEALAASPDGLSLADLARRLAVPKSSLSLLLRTLSRCGWVVLEPGGRRYRLGLVPQVLAAAEGDGSEAPADGMPLHRRAGPVLRALCRLSGETALLAEPTPRRDLRYTAKVVSRQVLRYDVDLGAERPLYCTAIGRAFTAAHSESQWGVLIPPDTPLRPLTRCTVTSRGELWARLREAAAAGFAVSVDETFDGVTAVAAAVCAGGRPVATVSVVGPTSRLAPRAGEAGDLVRAAARCLERLTVAAAAAPGDRRQGLAAEDRNGGGS
ncbi:MAG: helix-turn-helix domain-containing protein, partial [Clostridia bacterium]|nr:helix-turn-helix domain-containing protein [Clostridia bacterium]